MIVTVAKEVIKIKPHWDSTGDKGDMVNVMCIAYTVVGSCT